MRPPVACAVAAAMLFIQSCMSVTMIGSVRAHGDLHGLTSSDIQAAISAFNSHKQNNDLNITDIMVIGPTEIRVYFDGYWGDYATYVTMRRVRGRWIEDGGVIVTS